MNSTNTKKLVLFSSMLIGIYIMFSFGIVLQTLYSHLIVSSNLKSKIFEDKNPNEFVIGIISPFRGGELNQAMMVKDAAEKLGYASYVYVFNDLDTNIFLPAKYLNEILIMFFDYMYKPDLHLAMSFHANIDIPEPKIMYISVPENYVISKDKFAHYPEVVNFNNFLDINLLNGNYEMMEKFTGHDVNSAYGLVGFPATQFHNSSRQKLILYGSLWGRKSDEFFQALNILASQDYMYFIKNTTLLLATSTKQKFAPKAPNLKALIEILNDYGIGLCIHSKFHIEAAIPSSRIFEVISSGAIAISDMNPFVKKFFGDNVLYFDQTAPAKDIFEQINAHVHWVQTHPKEAEIMAKNAHEILQKNFTTEIFVQNLIRFYRKVYKKD